jgi:hypothetical protein
MGDGVTDSYDSNTGCTTRRYSSGTTTSWCTDANGREAITTGNTGSGVQATLNPDGSSVRVVEGGKPEESKAPVNTAPFTVSLDGGLLTCQAANTSGGYGRTCFFERKDGGFGVVGSTGFGAAKADGTVHRSGPIDRRDYDDLRGGTLNVAEAAAYLAVGAEYADAEARFDFGAKIGSVAHWILGIEWVKRNPLTNESGFSVKTGGESKTGNPIYNQIDLIQKFRTVFDDLTFQIYEIKSRGEAWRASDQLSKYLGLLEANGVPSTLGNSYAPVELDYKFVKLVAEQSGPGLVVYRWVPQVPDGMRILAGVLAAAKGMDAARKALEDKAKEYDFPAGPAIPGSAAAGAAALAALALLGKAAQCVGSQPNASQNQHLIVNPFFYDFPVVFEYYFDFVQNIFGQNDNAQCIRSYGGEPKVLDATFDPFMFKVAADVNRLSKSSSFVQWQTAETVLGRFSYFRHTGLGHHYIAFDVPLEDQFVADFICDAVVRCNARGAAASSQRKQNYISDFFLPGRTDISKLSAVGDKTFVPRAKSSLLGSEDTVLNEWDSGFWVASPEGSETRTRLLDALPGATVAPVVASAKRR